MPTIEQSQALADACGQAQYPDFFLSLFGEALDVTGDWDRAVELASDYDAVYDAPTAPDPEDADLKTVSDALAADEHGERPHQPDEYRDQDAWWGAVPDYVIGPDESAKSPLCGVDDEPAPTTNSVGNDVEIDYAELRRKIREMLE